MFVLYLVGVWQRNFEPVVCVYGTTGRRPVVPYTHTTVSKLRCQTRPSTRQTSVNEFQSSTALYSLMMDLIRSETCRS